MAQTLPSEAPPPRCDRVKPVWPTWIIRANQQTSARCPTRSEAARRHAGTNPDTANGVGKIMVCAADPEYAWIIPCGGPNRVDQPTIHPRRTPENEITPAVCNEASRLSTQMHIL